MITLGYFADGPWAHRALELISTNAAFKISFIVPRFEAPDPVLEAWAERLGVPFIPIQRVNARGAIARLKSLGADLFVSMSFDQIFKRPILDTAPLGVINCHAGALPFYRGRNILNWALINDEKSFGVTVHYVDEGIDTGNILVQRFVPITDTDSYATVLGRAIEACAQTLHEALVGLASGKLEAKVQSEIHPVGTYFGRRRAGDEWIDWSWSSRRIFNLVRGISPPGPCAVTALDGELIKILSAETIPDAPDYISTAGEIVGKTPGGLVVKTGDSTILVTAWESNVSPAKLRIGQRLAPREPVVNHYRSRPTNAASRRSLVIFGAGGHARSVADVALSAGFAISCFVDPKRAGDRILGFPIVGAYRDDPREHFFSVALGDNRAREIAREGEVAGMPLDRFPALIHPTASISDFARIGHGTTVMAGARVGPNSIVGNFCIVNTYASIDHDCRVDDFASVAPRAVTGGFVTIGKRSTVAMGAVVRNDIRIGADTILGAASYLDKNLPDNCVAYGVPARKIRANQSH